MLMGRNCFSRLVKDGVQIKEFRIRVVKQSNVGEVKPASVTEDVMFTQDVLFLSPSVLHRSLSSEEAAKLNVPKRPGLLI
ncbi:hypothetical protein C5167_026996 [Papaver somniferum]|nr:hypothetical protein C5167_026996 [Papaver somniferum]